MIFCIRDRAYTWWRCAYSRIYPSTWCM